MSVLLSLPVLFLLFPLPNFDSIPQLLSVLEGTWASVQTGPPAFLRLDLLELDKNLWIARHQETWKLLHVCLENQKANANANNLSLSAFVSGSTFFLALR